MPQSREQFRLLPENASVMRMSYVANLRTFVRVCELGSMSAAGRDQRISAAVASARIAELERHLGVRLFNRAKIADKINVFDQVNEGGHDQV